MNGYRITTTILRLSVLVLLPVMLAAQEQKKKIPLKDSLDGAFDMSDFILSAHGFVPIPVIITENALGGFGGGLVPVVIKPNPPYLDSVKGKLIKTPVAPNITGGIAAYTLNNTWVLSAFRSGTFVKSRIKYVVFTGYMNVNLSLYREVGNQGTKEFAFNYKMFPVFLQAIKRIGYTHWYAGLRYLFANIQVKYVGDKILPPELGEPEKYTRNISLPGAIVELDNRDNIFTPDKGMKVHIDGQCSDNIFGSDYDYWRMNYYMYWYKTAAKKFTFGWRVDGQQSFSDPPFFLEPFISMRGIPIGRYQGEATLLTEMETRWDFVKRWSLMLYGGVGKAFNDWGNFGSADLIYSYGTGFRYLMARKLKLRMGIDIAKGPPGSWGYYIVFGSNWLK